MGSGLVAEDGDSGIEAAQDRRIAGRAFRRRAGQLHQPNRAEARGETLQAARGGLPIGLATGAAEGVEMGMGALQKGRTQLRDEGRIVADGRGESGLQSSGIISHGVAVARQA